MLGQCCVNLFSGKLIQETELICILYDDDDDYFALSYFVLYDQVMTILRAPILACRMHEALLE